jgi:hypothetical protein
MFALRVIAMTAVIGSAQIESACWATLRVGWTDGFIGGV